MHETMTKSKWLEQVAIHAPKLRELIASYHPCSQDFTERPHMTITAPNVERIVNGIRKNIKREANEAFPPPVNPVLQFDRALADGDVSKIWTLLDQAWFGVPESTECWQIPGFKEAVDLMDDPPEMEGSE